MNTPKVLRAVGALLIIAGLLVLGYAGFSYWSTVQMERQLEARVPGQPASAATSPAPLTLPELSGSVPAMSPPTPLVEATVASTAAPSSEPTTIAAATITPPPLAAPTAVTITQTTPIAVKSIKAVARGQGKNPARLVIPRLKLDTPVREATWTTVLENGQPVSDWAIPFDAVGHLFNTADPGEAGNAVISGHHNLIAPNEFGLGKFAGLWNVQVGDPIFVFDDLGRVFVYRITQSYPLKEAGEPLAVREQHARQIMADNGNPSMTLITCWNGKDAPLSGNTYRWIVTASLQGSVDPDQVPSINN